MHCCVAAATVAAAAAAAAATAAAAAGPLPPRPLWALERTPICKSDNPTDLCASLFFLCFFFHQRDCESL